MILLTALGMAVAGGAAYSVQRDRVHDRVDRVLAQEVAEFDELATDGRDPTTGRPWVGLEPLFRVALQRQVLDRHELLAAFVNGRLSYVPASAPPIRLTDEPGAIAELSAISRTTYGDVDTSSGQMRYAAKVVRVDGDPDRGLYVVGYLTDDELSELGDVMQTYALVALLALLAVGAVGWVVAGRLLAPLRDLSGTAQRISASDLAGRISVSGGDDISDLARTFNAMLDRLEGAFATQRQFLDEVGHELRTPLTIVRGHLELLATDNPQEMHATRSLVLDELDRMSRMVEDLVTLAKAQRPDFLRLAQVEVNQLVDEVFEKARGLGRRTWRIDALTDTTVQGDPQRLTQALLQLAHNAVTHTSEGSEIGLGAQRTGERVEIWVRDTGPGVPPDHADRIFERWHRGDRRGVGAGLGLSIVRAIVEAHGGTVRVRQGDPGAVFVIDLPLLAVPPTLLEVTS